MKIDILMFCIVLEIRQDMLNAAPASERYYFQLECEVALGLTSAGHGQPASLQFWEHVL